MTDISPGPGRFHVPELSHPLAETLFAFYLLPSYTLHPSRISMLDPEPPDASQGDWLEVPEARYSLHRRWSEALIKRFGEQGEESFPELGDPALALAAAPPALLLKVARLGGAILLGKPLRQIVIRSEVAAARKALGEEAFLLVFSEAEALHPGISDCAPWLKRGFGVAADLLGAGLVAKSWEASPMSVRLRADLKLPESVDSPLSREASGLDAGQACTLCLKLLERLDPSWTSFFSNTQTH